MSNDITYTPTPRVDAALQKLVEVNAAPHEVAIAITHLARDIERNLSAAKATIAALENSEHPQVGELRSFKLACASKDRLLAEAKAENAALRKDSERLKWLFSGYAVARWSHEHEVGAVDRDTLMYSMFDLDDDMKASMEGGER